MFPWELHPAVVHFPLAFLISAVAIDTWRALRGRPATSVAAAGLLLAGVLTGMVAALLGVVAYYTVPAHTEDAHVRMSWHIGFAAAALVVAAPSAIARWRSRLLPAQRWMRVGTGLAGLLITVAGYLGGQLILRGGAGVDPALLSDELRRGHTHVHVAAGEVVPEGHTHAHAAISATSTTSPHTYTPPLGAPVPAQPAAEESPTHEHEHSHAAGAPPHHH